MPKTVHTVVLNVLSNRRPGRSVNRLFAQLRKCARTEARGISLQVVPSVLS